LHRMSCRLVSCASKIWNLSPGSRLTGYAAQGRMRRVIDRGALADQAELETDDLRLVQLGPDQLDGSWAMVNDAEGRRLTGTHRDFTREEATTWLGTLPGRDDRADWAVLRRDDDRYLGEAVLNHLEPENACMNFRIALFGDDVLGKGLGTQATRAVVAYGFDVVGLHRIELGVYDFNPRAQRVYEKVGFRREGVRRDALCWDGEWHDEILMALLAPEHSEHPA
jgi:RimJ/RimL family protein N-acetyltransferase